MRLFRVLGTAVAALAIELACMAVSARSATPPCVLTSADYEALAHAQKKSCPTCVITKQVVQAMNADQLQRLCAARKLARDLNAMTIDQFIAAYRPENLGGDPGLYMTGPEIAPYHDMQASVLENAVGSQARFWQTYTYSDLGFSAQFPIAGPPERLSLNSPTPWGPAMAQMVHSPIIYTELSITVVDIPTSAPLDRNDSEVLDAMTGVAIHQMGGKLISLSKITVSGAPGREFRISNGKYPTILGRYIWVRSQRRLYGLLCANTKPGAAGEPGMKRFTQSLVILNQN